MFYNPPLTSIGCSLIPSLLGEERLGLEICLFSHLIYNHLRKGNICKHQVYTINNDITLWICLKDLIQLPSYPREKNMQLFFVVNPSYEKHQQNHTADLSRNCTWDVVGHLCFLLSPNNFPPSFTTQSSRQSIQSIN
jgi:hypothetical protein